MGRLAGAWVGSGDASSSLEARLRSSLEDHGVPKVVRHGPLLVGAVSPARWFSSESLFCIVCGRIDNGQALARELGLDRRPPDPELMLAVYRSWGEEALTRLRGAFTVLLWDREAAHGILAVDQLGSASLFYAEGNGSLAFASEPRVLLRVLPRRPGPDPIAAAQWLVQSSLQPGRTLFDGIRRLRGGHLVRMLRTTWSVQEYWRPRYAGTLQSSSHELVAELRSAIETGVRRRLSEEGPSGVLVSGGMDSSTVVATAAKLAARQDLLAYSIVFPEHETMDESPLIELLTDRLGVRSIRVPVRGGSPLAELANFVGRFDLPYHSPNLIISVPVMRVARDDGVSVLLDGEGGDELFGLSRYLFADLLRRARVLSAVRLSKRIPGLPQDRRVHRIVLREWGLKGGLPYAFHRLARRLHEPRHYTPPWLTPQSARFYVETDDSWDWKQLAGPCWWTSLAYRLTTGREARGHDSLRQLADYAGVESRHPFLDDLDLIELALRIPPELVFDPTFDRPLLREAVRGLVPDDIRLRAEKTDLTDLWLESLKRVDWPMVMRLLGSGTPEVGAFIEVPVMRKTLLEASESRRKGGWGLAVWRLLALECWLRHESDPSFAGRLLEELNERPEVPH
jgi:asparagine synthase (glutamine-hydrolysing)